MGLGITNNANYSSNNLQSDAYLWVKNFSYLDGKFSSSSHFSLNQSTKPSNFWSNPISFLLMYKQFTKEIQNNVLLWNISLSLQHFSFLNKGDAINLGLGGQKYTTTNPQTSESGFDQNYLDLSYLKSIDTGKLGLLILEPGYQIKRIEDSSRRMEYCLSITSSMDLELNFNHSLTPLFALAFVNSSDPLYNKNYIDLTLDWHWLLKESWSLQTSFFHRESWFPKRTLSNASTLPVAKRNQKSGVLSQNKIELHKLTQIESSLTKDFKSFYTKATIISASQTSLSHTEDYNEARLQFSIGTKL